MARQPRIDYPGAVHHVMNRGAAHQDIFRDDRDRQMFLDLWSQAVARFGIVVVSYCLMGNHFHFLVESPSEQLSRTLQFVLQKYTQSFNARHGRDGALFRGRFHSVLVDSDVYFERVGRYIELNPATAGLVSVDRLDDYKWSSFRAYSGRARRPPWLAMHRMLSRYQQPEQYLRFVQSKMADLALDRFYASPLRPGVVLGTEDFIHRLSIAESTPVALIAGVPTITLSEIDRIVARELRCVLDAVHLRSSGTSAIARGVAIDLGHLLTGCTRNELAAHYKFASAASAGNAIRTNRNSADSDVRQLRESVLKALHRDNEGHALQR